MLPGVLDFLCGNAAERLGPFLCLVVASDKISASVTLPERQRMQIGSVRVYFAAGCQSYRNFCVASAAP